MEPSLINLLPPKRVRLFRRAYFVRLLTTTIALGIGFMVIHATLLFPAYIFLEEKILTREAKLKGLNEVQSPEQQKLASHLALFEKNASRLSLLDTTPAASDILRTLLAVPRANITLSGFTFTPESGENEYRLLITGTAATREALRQYDNTLSSLSFVRSVELPIATYSKETNLPFTITLTGTTP